MITQTIKNWLSNLFAWWPWKRRAMAAYTPPHGNGVLGMSTEHSWDSESSDGSLPQTGVRSVAVEQSNDIAPLEEVLPPRPPLIEHGDRVVQSSPLREVFTTPQVAQDKEPVEKPTEVPTEFTPEKPPTSEQQLAFLRYLVSHGLINEGFEEGNVPEQYRPKK